MGLDVRHVGSIEAVNRNQWNNVVDQSDLSCVYHRYEWLRAVEEGLSHEPKHVVVSKSGNPIAVLPNFVTELGRVNRLSSIRPGYGGPIAMTDEEESLELLLDAVEELCTGRILFDELRTYDQNYVRYHDFLEAKGYRPTILTCRFTLDLSRGWEELFEGMDSERRRGIRRGHDSEFDVAEEDLDGRTLEEFYRDYAAVADRVGLPTHPRSFFRELRGFDDRIVVFSLRVDGGTQGRYMYLLDEEQSTLQHLFTAVTEDHFEYHAPELLHEHAIKWGIEEGYDTYELRGSPPDFRNGVFRFKEYFGAETIPLLVYERGHPAPALPVLNAGRTISRRLES
ncbi:GNAT family N-acetyltransferase [Natrarchaeobius chitinivorans]|uniref:Peptidoglycan bridge formation glycyltransferase FemA/FemB family protein n=1 Tax=Natrarchaeobius chitinivorans TaxID=1679083 RepID=A0A3N6M725_NATCH|nr:GNAT family N-acetyltransferase [Natrarchaeobius chitinivorans]RQG96424.1 peptidoglycan bridge formation glycyltransferase FemA/FemB family protein [Natrarchaeobius chitinivorans]